MISVVIKCANLNKINVHVKILKIRRQPVHWFELTEPNETMGIMYGSNILTDFKNATLA